MEVSKVRLRIVKSSAEPLIRKLAAFSPTTITEKREQGRVTEIKVNSSGSAYTLKPNSPAGSSQPGDMTSGNNRGPQWTLFEFDLGSNKTQPKVPDTTDNVPAPVPPPPR